eukprot:GHVU01135442.1.p1 GENE.GHVU01135442.1~~GHVU01135442.1.p1  ORF type:complete len:156 (-),score=9.69 GHVU01135442.1:87-554(-)
MVVQPALAIEVTLCLPHQYASGYTHQCTELRLRVGVRAWVCACVCPPLCVCDGQNPSPAATPTQQQVAYLESSESSESRPLQLTELSTRPSAEISSSGLYDASNPDVIILLNGAPMDTPTNVHALYEDEEVFDDDSDLEWTACHDSYNRGDSDDD